MEIEKAMERGYLLTEEIEDTFPSEERLRRGMVAIIECPQEIPCNPCVESCPFGAITMEGGINGVPVVDYDRCTGCTLCAQVCPGHAIFLARILDDSRAVVVVPHEFLPVPERGEEVKLLDRAGRDVGRGRVLWLLRPEREVHYYLVALEVPRELWKEVRALEVIK